MKPAKLILGLITFIVFLISLTAVSAWHDSYTYDGQGGYYYQYGYDSYRPHVSTSYRSVGYYYPTNYVDEYWNYPQYSYGQGYSGYPAQYVINSGRPYYANNGAMRYYAGAYPYGHYSAGGYWPNYAQTRYYR